jgi:hypothetical protein
MCRPLQRWFLWAVGELWLVAQGSFSCAEAPAFEKTALSARRVKATAPTHGRATAEIAAFSVCAADELVRDIQITLEWGRQLQGFAQ